MKNFCTKLWKWLFNRSPQNAAKPNVQPNPTESVESTSMPTDTGPFETYRKTESIFGGPIKIGFEENALRGPGGQLIRAHNKLSILLGCNHIVTRFQASDQEGCHVRGIAGKCFYCDAEYQKLSQKGQISPFDAERLSLVCADCGKITLSGQLCCPKHYTAVLNPDGTTTYLSPEDTEEQNRQNTIKNILGSMAQLFGKETSEQNIQDQNNG